MLGELEEAARRDQLRQQLRHHADETREQIRNIEQAFRDLDAEPDDKPCLVIDAIDKEGKANIKKADDELVDAVILSGAAETEHHEIAVYEQLITQAETMGHTAVVTLLRQNLEQEQHTLREVQQATQQIAQGDARAVA
jgi:ferritin-like metal-binding protein YciE